MLLPRYRRLCFSRPSRRPSRIRLWRSWTSPSSPWIGSGPIPRQTVVVRGGRIVAIGPSSQVKVPAGGAEGSRSGQVPDAGPGRNARAHPGRRARRTASSSARCSSTWHGGITTIRGMLGHPAPPGSSGSAQPETSCSAPRSTPQGLRSTGTACPTPEARQREWWPSRRPPDTTSSRSIPALPARSSTPWRPPRKRVGIGFAGHVPLEVGLARALEAGYATIDHLDGYVEAMVREGSPVTAEESEFFGLNLGEHLDESKLPALVEATREARCGTSQLRC